MLTSGSLILAVLGSLSMIAGPRMTFRGDGEVLPESSGLVPLNVHTILSAVGLVLLVVGVLLVLSQLARVSRVRAGRIVLRGGIHDSVHILGPTWER